MRALHIKLIIRLLLVASLTLFVIGAFAPLISITRLVFFANEFSLITGIAELYSQNEAFLALLIAAFSGVAPLVKLTGLWLAVTPIGISAGAARILEHLGRWSMLEVFVVALMVVAVKLGALASATVHWGAYALAGSAMLSLAASGLAIPAKEAIYFRRAWPTFASGLLVGGLAGLAVYHLLNRVDIAELLTTRSNSETPCIERIVAGISVSMQSAVDISEHVSTLAALDAAQCPEDFREALDAHAEAWRDAFDRESGNGFFRSAVAWVRGWFRDEESADAPEQNSRVPDDVRSSWQELEEVAAGHGVEVRRPDW